MNKLVVTIATLFMATAVVPATANTESTIVIIDSGFDTSSISNNVVEEICITSISSGCNNGESFEIGAGASQTTAPIASRYLSDWNHGTIMAQEAIAVNPDINLILIRNASVSNNGNVLFGGQSSLESALEWVYNNAETYNIAAVSMSRGSHSYVLQDSIARKQLTYIQIYSGHVSKMSGNPRFARSLAVFEKKLDSAIEKMNSLPDIKCPVSLTLSNLVADLMEKNIATMFATGNDYNSRYVDSPACIDDAIAIGAADSSGKRLPKSNVAPNTDFLVAADNTSIATAKLAAKWSLVYNGSYSDTYNLISSFGSNSHSWSAIFVP